jgi:hypothetical protein
VPPRPTSQKRSLLADDIFTSSGYLPHMEGPHTNRKAFVSHTHSDKEQAQELAIALRERGVESWLDKWEIQPGDSLIQKIFTEGLRDCSVFLVLLSPESITSNWVRNELDVALIRRIEGQCRVIPIIVKQCEIPPLLRTLLYLYLKNGVATVAQDVANVVFNIRVVPPVAAPPSQLRFHLPGLTPLAARVAAHLFGSPEGPPESDPQFHATKLAVELSLSPADLGDAVDELEEQGVAKVIRTIGCGPSRFTIVMPTYRLALRLRGTQAIGYDPEADARIVANAIVSQGSSDGSQLVALTALPPVRINAAVQHLEHQGVVGVIRVMGTAPFAFRVVNSTSATRRFVAMNT